MKEKTYSVFNISSGREWKAGEDYVKNFADKENIKQIYEHVDGDVEITYKDGTTRCYENIFGEFVLEDIY